MTWTNGIDNSGGNPATLWDSVHFDDYIQPGTWTVEVKGANGLDIQKAKNKKNAKVIDNGQAPMTLSMTVRLQPEDLAVFSRRTLPRVRPRSARGGQPVVRILHPNAQLFGINYIKCMSFNSPMPASGGLLIMTMEWVHISEEKDIEQGRRIEVPTATNTGEILDSQLTIDANQSPESDLST